MPVLSSELPIARRLFEEPFAFDFFQAVRLLRHLAGDHGGLVPAGRTARFSAHLSLAFPASAIHDLAAAEEPDAAPKMTVTFLGLFGPSGVLPRHYTEMLLRIERDVKGAEKRALRDWLDLFNHRLTALFYAAWEKYRFVLPFERGEADRREPEEPDTFTRGLLSLVGLGTRRLRDRIRVDAIEPTGEVRRLAAVDDLGLLRFAGLLSQQHRSAWGLGALLSEYFQVPVAVQEFQGQWLVLDEPSQTRLGVDDWNGDLGLNAVAGDRVWDIQGKFRVRLGPLRFAQFTEFLPDPDPAMSRKAFFLLAQVARLYAGPEFDFDVQLVLEADHVPACVLDDHDAGPRLGWNSWLLSGPHPRDADDAVFDGELAARGG
jgi:type VI secretion system protein ImpH